MHCLLLLTALKKLQWFITVTQKMQMLNINRILSHRQTEFPPIGINKGQLNKTVSLVQLSWLSLVYESKTRNMAVYYTQKQNQPFLTSMKGFWHPKHCCLQWVTKAINFPSLFLHVTFTWIVSVLPTVYSHRSSHLHVEHCKREVNHMYWSATLVLVHTQSQCPVRDLWCMETCYSHKY